MKKMFLSCMLLFLLIPFMVNAEECDMTKITITTLEQKGIEGKTEVIKEPTFKDRTIDFNFKMYDIGDSISYEMTINNVSDDDYMIDESTFKTDSEFIEYSLQTKDGNNVVKAKSSKEVVLSVIYKTEVDDSLFENGKYNATNELKFTLNSNDKEKKMNVITTSDTKNPNTNINKMKTIVIFLFFSAIISILTIFNKTKFNKCAIFIFALTLIPVVYAICKCDIEIKAKIEIEHIPDLYETMEKVAGENTCITKYEGEVTDEVGNTVQAKNVYFNNCPDKRNVIFGNQCWQIIRTTETKGIKMIYNGIPVDGKCESTREEHNGITSGSTTTLDLPDTYLYASSFTYDEEEKTFTLVNPSSSKWSDSTYKNLLGKYTCKNTNGVCSRIYNINDYSSNTKAKAVSYTIDKVNYSTIGVSPFNANTESASAGGYMFDRSYNIQSLDTGVYDNYLFGNDFSYDSENNQYTLTNTVGPFRGIENMSTMFNHHYTCFNTSGTCEKIFYLIYIQASNYHFIELENGESIEDALTNMLDSDKVNKYNSSIKGIIDNWYYNNFMDYTSYLEDNTYCNDRTIASLGAWNPNSGPLNRSTTNFLKFKAYDRDGSDNKNISCKKITDQFSTSNNKAKLQYPIGLFSFEELNNINSNDLLKSNINYWTMSLSDYGYYFGTWIVITNQNGSPMAGFIPTSGLLHHGNSIDTQNGIRPAISLKRKINVIGGTGSLTEPWILK